MLFMWVRHKGVSPRVRGNLFKLAKFLDSNKSDLRIQNKDSLCLVRAIVTDIAQDGA